MIIVMVSNY